MKPWQPMIDLLVRVSCLDIKSLSKPSEVFSSLMLRVGNIDSDPIFRSQHRPGLTTNGL